jgi:16S rRNA (guanine527-N7)-methyltransferase
MPVQLVTARALAPLPMLLALAHPLLAPGGVCLFPKGRTVAEELTAAKREWHMHVEARPSHTDPAATLLRLSEISRAGNAH